MTDVRDVPRLVVAAPSSGAGKTTVATGLMAALAGRGMKVSPHKVGPDYIDPGYHTLAAGRPGRNLDPWLTSEDLIAPLLLHGARGADIAVIEGVMGLYDGVHDGAHDTGRDYASTSHVARLLQAPVVLVVDAARQGQSVAALAHGFASFDTRVRFGGVILNRIGSDRHEEICRAALDAAGVPVLGAIRRTAAIETPSRHLGLIPVAERRAEAIESVARLGDLIRESCDLDALVRLARTAPPLADTPWSATAELRSAGSATSELVTGESSPAELATAESVTAGFATGSSPTVGSYAFRGGSPGRPAVVAIAGGAAFTFGYAEQAELLAAAGAEVVTFDPLRDESLPPGAAGLVLPGGFPEMYATELAANEPMRACVAAFEGPIAAECAGLLYLCRELDGRPMCGLVDAKAEMTDRLTLGYRDAVAVRNSILTREGERFRGHEFHRTACTPPEEPAFRWKGGADGYAPGRVLAAYLHLHWAGSPELATRFVEACA